MDHSRYGLQQGWENNSALEGYGPVHEPNFRVGGSYDDRRFVDERFSRDNVYSRNAFHRDLLERENYPQPAVALWPQARRRGYEEDYALERDSRRHEKPYTDSYHEIDSRHVDHYRDPGFGRSSRYAGRDRDDCSYDDYDYRTRYPHQGREDSRERDYDYGRQSYDSDYERGSSRRDGNWRRRDSRDRERDKRDWSHERDDSPYRRNERSRSRSYGRDDRPRSRSPRGRSHREDSYDDRYERSERRRDRDDKRQSDQYSVAPSATVVVKGLSQKTTEEDIYQILAEWGPLRHVRVIKERNSGVSRGFAFIDFPSVDAAQAMMDKLGEEGLVVDGRKLFFEYSSKPTGGGSGLLGSENPSRSGHGSHRSITIPSDWMCTICGCVNFARRTSCFQCNEKRTDDAPPADMASSNPTPSKRGEAGPTHVLVVRGLDENADEEMLRYEFSKHAPIKDLRLVRDKFTHVSRGFAFVHFYTVEDATKALEATNGTTLEKNGQILRVAYAKSILGPGSSGASGASQSSSLAAAAIEAATFAQQYDAVGWAPKEYNPDDKQAANGQEQGGVVAAQSSNAQVPQSGFVWDEASGYYYDAASGFYYDGNTGLYYDGNSGTWYSYDNQTQQYVPYTDPNDKTAEKQTGSLRTLDGSSNRKVVISAPAATITEKTASLPDAIQAAANAAIAAEKKEKEKSKEIRFASKSSILANKKKMNNVLTMWKQRSHEGQAPRVALDENLSFASMEDRPKSVGSSTNNKLKMEAVVAKENISTTSGLATNSGIQTTRDSDDNAQSASSGSGGPLKGVIRGSGLGLIKLDNVYGASLVSDSTGLHAATPSAASSTLTYTDTSSSPAPFRTDASALGSYSPAVTATSGRRRFSEMPQQSALLNREQPQSTYRDRAAERRNLYGSSSFGDDLKQLGDSNRNSTSRRGSLDSMPFPPGVGGGARGTGDSSSQSYDVITADRAIDEKNVGNRILRNMGWNEGSGLGKDGSGIVEPVVAQAMDGRGGLGSQPKKVDPSLEVQAGDSYKTLIQKKAIARFREMS